jgi:hypothetical protein
MDFKSSITSLYFKDHQSDSVHKTNGACKLVARDNLDIYNKMVNPYRNLHGELLKKATLCYQNLSRGSVVDSFLDEDRYETQSDGRSYRILAIQGSSKGKSVEDLELSSTRRLRYGESRYMKMHTRIHLH